MSVESPFAALLAELPTTHDVVQVLGSATHYWTYGPADATTTIVLTHGYRGEHHGLEPIVAHLRDVRIISPDLPGFGKSSPLIGAPHNIPGYAAWLAAFIETLALEEPPIVLGHSFGSIVTAYAVAEGLVTTPKLILVNPIAAPATSGSGGILTRGTMLFYRSSMIFPEKMGRWMLGNWAVVRFMSMSLAKTKDKHLRRWIHDQHHTYFSDFYDRATVVESFTASVTNDVSEVGTAITVPTLLIGAELDLITPVRALHKLRDNMPDATLHVIPGVGHLIHYEKAPIAAHQIVDFLGVGRVVESAQPADR